MLQPKFVVYKTTFSPQEFQDDFFITSYRIKTGGNTHLVR